jgi:phosphoribosylanthranilate isomerase
MRTRIKFCGLVREVDVDAAVTLGVDAVGFVFYPRSPRALAMDEAAALRRRLPSFVAAVGLFVDASASHVIEVAGRVGLDVLQFHGDETPTQAALAAQGAGLPWWKAIRMRAETDLLSSAQTFHEAECLILDAYSEAYGGSGKSFDWSWIPPELPARVVLSGGLGPETVGAAIARVRPFAVDVSSGIQGEDPRAKDWARMERFVAAVLAADTKRP